MHIRRQPMASRGLRFLRSSAAAGALLWLLHTFLSRGSLVSPDRISFQSGRLSPAGDGVCAKRCTRPPSSGRESTADAAVTLYTAYYDEVALAIDVVSAAAAPQPGTNYYCHVWSETGDGECVFAAEVERVLSARQIERNSLLTVHRCRYRNYTADLSTRVAIANSESCQRSANRGLPVHSRGAFFGQRTVQFAVCCLPEWDATGTTMNIDPENLISFVETNSFIGAGKFYFYNTTSSESELLDQILAYYKSKNLIEVVQWTASSDSLKAARQDCLHRSRAEAEYVIFLSVHDVLVPAEGTTWKDIVQQGSLLGSPAAYRFTSVLFGAPSTTPCSVSNSTLTRVAAKVKSLQYTLFSRVTSANNNDKRFHRMMYDLGQVRSHPSFRDDWLATGTGAKGAPGQHVAQVDSKSASIKNYDSRPILTIADRSVRVQPLKYSFSLCQHSTLILERISLSCAACTS